MAASRKPKDRSSWLGDAPRGGERLARVFQIGSAARAAELEAELAQLRAKVVSLELELSALHLHADRSDGLPDVRSDAPLVELPRALLRSERDYRLSRCEGFAVYAGARVLGVVEGVRYESSSDRPDVLEVRGRRLGLHVLLVPVNDIEAIKPEDKAIVVKDALCPRPLRERVHTHLARLGLARIRTPTRTSGDR